MKTKKLLSMLASACLLTPSFTALQSCIHYDLVVFNWGEYMDIEVLWAFEDTYDVSVKYLTFDSNETMLQKIQGGTRYDVVFPSDYAVEEMAQKDYIEPLSYYDGKWEYYKEDDIVPLLRNSLKKLDEEGLCTDKDGNKFSCTADEAGKYETREPGFDMLEYAVPYTFGQIGILYNTEKISRDEIEKSGYDALKKEFNDDGSPREVVLYDSSKDIVSMAMLATGHDFQHEDAKAMADAENWLRDLISKKGDHLAIKADELLDDIPNELHDIAFTFSGDAIYCIDATYDEELDGSKWDFYVPEAKNGSTVRSNIYADAMVVMKNSPAKDLAFKFIDFMSSHDAAYLNSVYIGYTSTRNDVYEEITNPDENYECKHHDVAELTENENHESGLYSSVPAYRLFAEKPGQIDKFYRYNEEYKKHLEELYTKVILQGS